jgi:hypothetical protein
VVIITQERLDEITLNSIPDAGLFLGEFDALLVPSPTRLEGLAYATARRGYLVYARKIK